MSDSQSEADKVGSPCQRPGHLGFRVDIHNNLDP